MSSLSQAVATFLPDHRISLIRKHTKVIIGPASLASNVHYQQAEGRDDEG
jgi:hypothetical protein